MNEPQEKFKSRIVQSFVVLFTLMAIGGTMFCTSAFGGAAAAPEEEAVHETEKVVDSSVAKFGLVAAAAAFGLGALGAGFAISHVGSAAMGAIAEKPQIAGQALIFVALAEGLVVFGFITALMILAKV